MHANNEERGRGAVDQEAFEKVIRDNLSPEGIATILAFLQPALNRRPQTAAQTRGFHQAEWFYDTLLELLGVDECNRLFEELSL